MENLRDGSPTTLPETNSKRRLKIAYVDLMGLIPIEVLGLSEPGLGGRHHSDVAILYDCLAAMGIDGVLVGVN